MTSQTPLASKPEPEAGTPPADTVLVPRPELQALVHDLRNHINSMLMNAGVLATLCNGHPKAARYAAQLEDDGERCAQALRDVSDRYL